MLPPCTDVRRGPCSRSQLRAVAVARPRNPPPEQPAAGVAGTPGAPAERSAERPGGSKGALPEPPSMIKPPLFGFAFLGLVAVVQHALLGDTPGAIVSAFGAGLCGAMVLMALALKALLGSV